VINDSNQNLSHHMESGCLIVQIKDRFDERNCNQIQEKISDLLKKELAHLLLDLNNVRAIRSSGLRVILSLAKDFKDKDKKFFVVYSKNDENHQVAQILKVSGFAKIISICSTKKEAIEHCSKSSNH